MNAQNHILEVPALLTNKISKRLIFEHRGLTIERPFGLEEALFVPAENLSAIRLGEKWVSGLSFVSGKHFIIDLLHPDETTTQIQFSSYCGLRLQTYEEAWTATVNHLYSFYFSSQVSMYIELFHIRQPFELLGITFHGEGVSWGNNGIIPWKQISLSNYKRNFVVHHGQNVRVNVGFSFLNDWNAYILFTMLKYVIQEHKKLFSK